MDLKLETYNQNYYQKYWLKKQILLVLLIKYLSDLFLYKSIKTTIEKTNTILIIPVRLLVKTNAVKGMIEIKYQALDFLAK